MRSSHFLGVLFLLLGCASATNESRGPLGGEVITQQQILEAGSVSLYDVVRLYHPEWIPVGEVERQLTVVDGDLRIQGRGPDFLKTRGTHLVYELEYLIPRRAASVIRPSISRGPAIIVRSRSGS
jgi:hypothetical protein